MKIEDRCGEGIIPMDDEPPTVRDYQREEHSNWVFAMRELEKAINSTRQNGELFFVNSIPRESFSEFEEAIRDWAISFARL